MDAITLLENDHKAAVNARRRGADPGSGAIPVDVPSKARDQNPYLLCERIWREIADGGAPSNPADLLDQLAAIALLRQTLDVEEAAAVHDLRAIHRWSWSAIAHIYDKPAQVVAEYFSDISVIPPTMAEHTGEAEHPTTPDANESRTNES